MEVIKNTIKTLTGNITVSGQLESLTDLSFPDLKRNIHLEVFELGYNLKGYHKVSQKLIKSEYNVRVKKILNVLFSQPKYSDMLVKNYKKFNRYEDVLPCDFYIDNRNLVPSKDYINASFVSGIDYPAQKNLYIATQAPLDHTFFHFFDMAFTHKCSSIFMLCGSDECEKVS